MKIEVYADKATKDIIKAFKELNKDEINKSIYRSINSTLAKVQTETSKQLRNKYNVSASQVKKGFYLSKASPSNLTGKLFASNRTLPLQNFNPVEIKGDIRTKRVGGKKGSYQSKQIKNPTKQGVYIEILKGEKKLITSAFLLLRGSNASVKARGEYSRGFDFINKEKSKSLSSVSVHSMMRNSEIQQDIKSYTEKEYQEILFRELKKRVTKSI